MVKKVLCDWFLSDGIHPRVRLDAPNCLEEALEGAGVIRHLDDLEARQANEWIYRRTWRYEAEFTLPGQDKRAFLRVTGLNGNWSVLVNGAEAANGEGDSCEFEITALLSVPNRIELRFFPYSGPLISPVVGFNGMLSYRQTGKIAITEATVTHEDAGARIFTGLSSIEGGKCEVEYRLKNAAGEWKVSHKETLAAGYAPLMKEEFSGQLQPGENLIGVSVKEGGESSDEKEFSLYLPASDAPARGLAGKGEALMGLAEEACANAAFSLQEEPDERFKQMASRHQLVSLTLQEGEGFCPPDALAPCERLIALAGSERALEKPAFWALSDSKRDCLDAALKLVPSGDLESAVNLSRYLQAQTLRSAALDARLAGQSFAVLGARDGLNAPASCALTEDGRALRPAFYALLGAWQPQTAFVRLPKDVPEDGVMSAEVCFVSDWEDEGTCQVSVSCHALDGREVGKGRFAASQRGLIGRMLLEIPEEGCMLVRTSLTREDELVSVMDEIVMKPGVYFEDLPKTQLLPADGRMRNVGKSVALGVTVPGAAYFGCLVPGEYVGARRADPYKAEGLNIYF